MRDKSQDEIIHRAERLLDDWKRGNGPAGKELMEILPQLDRIAATGRPDVQAFVACMNLEYLGNTAKAYRLFKESAAAGHPAGQRGLGYMLLGGLVLKKTNGKPLGFLRPLPEPVMFTLYTIFLGCMRPVWGLSVMKRNQKLCWVRP